MIPHYHEHNGYFGVDRYNIAELPVSCVDKPLLVF